MPDIIVVGDIDTDLFYLVPHLPTWDEGVLVSEWYQKPGGKGGNTAATLSHLGHNTGIISVAGDDRYGRIALNGLKDADVDISGVTIVPEGDTYYCIMILDKTGEKAILVVSTNLIYPTQKMMSDTKTLINHARHAHFIGLDPIRMEKTIILAKKMGLTISIDLDAAYQGIETCSKIIRHSDIVLLNRQGSSSLFPGIEFRQVVNKICQMGPKVAVITAGDKGVVGCQNSVIVERPAFKVDVVDTTGAGDAFSGGFIHSFLHGWSLESSLDYASGVAALSTLAIGGQSNLPKEHEVFDFLKKHGH